MYLVFIYVNVRSLVLVQLKYVSSICSYDERYNIILARNISTVGWVEGRAAVQAWGDIHVKVSGLFPFGCSRFSLELCLCAAAVLFPSRR